MEIGGEGEEVVSMPISTSYATPNDSSRLRMLASSAACPDDADDTTNNGHGHGHGHPGHGHGHGHSQSHAHNNNSAGSIIRRRGEKQQARAVRYRECLKNHAATLGGHVTDGCGEFMPAGDHGTADSLRCAACDCHRNFHRREVEGEEENCEACYQRRATGLVGHPPTGLLPAPLPSPALPFAARAPPQVLAFRTTDDHSEGFHSPPGGLSSGSVKKRFRTKFTADQKERMLSFAQRLGWRIQKHDESSVQNFCQEVGVKRHVLKVWMHNNKHAYTRGGGGGTPGSGGGASSALAHTGDHLININSNNHMHDNAVTTTTATNSSSNNDSTHSERDFQ